MPAYFRSHPGLTRCTWLALLLLLCGAGKSVLAQGPPAPRWELYAGYSALDFGASVHGILPGGIVPSAACLCWDTRGAGVSLTYNLNRWFGLTADMSGDWPIHETDPFERFDHAAFYNVSGGPKITLRTQHFAPFAEALFGGHRLTPEIFHPDDEFGLMAGGGVDIPLSTHFAFRLIRADYVYSNHQFGPSATVAATDLSGVRLQSGIVFMFGGRQSIIPHTEPTPPLPQPPAVVAMEPPTVTCSSSPASVMPGGSSLITATGVSPQNRPLTYNYTASAGSISGTSSTATLLSAGAAAGVVTVTCGVADDRGQTASATTDVTIMPAAIVPTAVTSDLCAVGFARDARRPARVDNEAKACLDEVALNLQRTPDATLALIGTAASEHHGDSRLAAQRAVNTKAYLVGEKGIDASRVAVYTGSGDTDAVTTTLIPAGASLDAQRATPVDESQFKANPRGSGRSAGGAPR